MTSKFSVLAKNVAAALATFAFLGAGLFKLSGAPEMIEIFKGFGMPIAFMYFIGACEVAGAVGLWLRNKTIAGFSISFLAALGLAILMLGGFVVHLINDPIDKAIPALVLFMLASFLVYSFKKKADELTL